MSDINTTENEVVSYKGYPLIRNENILYYGNMQDSHIIMMQILETKMVKDLKVATRVSVQLQQTDENIKGREKIVKTAEKDGLYNALDIGYIWLNRTVNKG